MLQNDIHSTDQVDVSLSSKIFTLTHKAFVSNYTFRK